MAVRRGAGRHGPPAGVADDGETSGSAGVGLVRDHDEVGATRGVGVEVSTGGCRVEVAHHQAAGAHVPVRPARERDRVHALPPVVQHRFVVEEEDRCETGIAGALAGDGGPEHEGLEGRCHRPGVVGVAGEGEGFELCAHGGAPSGLSRLGPPERWLAEVTQVFSGGHRVGRRGCRSATSGGVRPTTHHPWGVVLWTWPRPSGSRRAGL